MITPSKIERYQSRELLDFRGKICEGHGRVASTVETKKYWGFLASRNVDGCSLDIGKLYIWVVYELIVKFIPFLRRVIVNFF